MDHSLISLLCSLRLVCLLNSLLFLSCLFLSYFHVYDFFLFLQSNRSVKIVFLGFALNAKPGYGYNQRKLNKLQGKLLLR